MTLPNKDMCILVVDDFGSQRGMVKHCLKELQFLNILEASNGSNALEQLRKEKIDFVISDWTMPNMSGIELLRAVRAEQRWKELPFLMITAEAERSLVLEAIQAGVSNFIVKPFNTSDLEKKIASLFKNRRE